MRVRVMRWSGLRGPAYGRCGLCFSARAYPSGLRWVTRLLVILGLFCHPQYAFAARPFITDDARVVDAHACQLESWARLDHDGNEYWALPGCNVTGNLEVTAGGAWLSDEGEPDRENHLLQIQLKTLGRTLTTNGYGWGLAVGGVVNAAAHPDRELLGNVYLYAPVSSSWLADRLITHVNVGARHERGLHATHFTWGVAGEYSVTARIWALAEFFGSHDEPPLGQCGLRVWIVPQRLQVDATYGRQLTRGQDSEWFSLGLRLLSPTLW